VKHEGISMRPTDHYTNTVTVEIPADTNGKSLHDDGVLADVVASGMLEVPCVAQNHVHGRFNEFMYALQHGDPQERYNAAVQLAGIALRHAWEHRIKGG
jgi:hypothetical protein